MENALAFLFVSILAGLFGAMAMDGFMYLASYESKQRIRMTEALGSLVTGKLEGARMIGIAIHFVSGLMFGFIYGLILAAAHATKLPFSIFMGMGLGLFHGLFFSYCLMFVASSKHPVQKYRDATFQTGALHLLGHIVFGGVVGLVIGLAPVST